MKKATLLFVFFCMLINLMACGNVTTSKTIENNGTPSENRNIYIEKTNEKEIIVTVIEKNNIPKNTIEGRYSDRVEFAFTVKNLTEKSIKGIQGTLTVKDLFDDKIISIGCDFTGKQIPANGTTTYKDIGIDINQFMDNHTKLYNEKFEDLKFTYEIENIVYSDSDSNSQQNSIDTNTNSNVQVEVTNKYNRDKDYSAGQYSERVEFSFRITNTGSKGIKGVQGTLIVKDLFQENLISIECDFTGNTISPNSYITVSDFGIDINQFMDNHLKLYNEKYEDLNFEYKVKTIVYTDSSVDNF